MRPTTFAFSCFLLMLISVIVPGPLAAQPAPLAETLLEIGLQSGTVEAPKTSRGPRVVFSTMISDDDAAWIRLFFGEVVLAGKPAAGDGSFLRLTSQLDGVQQTLDSEELESWSFSSAYFNGSKVLVEIVAFPGTGPNGVFIASAAIGSQFPRPLPDCGEDDPRAASADPRIGRLLPVGCTAFLIDEDDCANRFLTAGHCIGGSGVPVVQFNVPPSRTDGVIVHPPAEDQYPVDPGSLEATDVGIGRDFATFVVGLNSETGS
ncbi:MAG: hypothetical protein AAF725_12865, partial [Acidobacteriota bacterium]